MALARHTAATQAELRSEIREEVNDPSLEPGGGTRPTALLKYTDTSVDRALNNQLLEMNEDLGDATGNGWRLLSANFTLDSAGEADLTGSIGLGAAGIYKAERQFGSAWEPLHRISPHEIEQISGLGALLEPLRYAVLGGATPATASVKLAVRPAVEGAVIRVSYIAAPILPGADSDAVSLSERWRELIVLGAALKLMRRDGEATPEQREDHARLRRLFIAAGAKQRGPRFVRSARRSIP